VGGCLGKHVCPFGIVMDVVDSIGEVGGIQDAAAVEAFLSDIQVAFELKGEASLDVLHGLFE
jgi:hypothetical protein